MEEEGGRGIRVICRFRPQNAIEDGKGGECCVDFLTEKALRVREHEFTFDRVFDGRATQSEIYREVQPAVQDLLAGYNATIFAYGQTSSGKTYTMQGPDIDDAEKKGIIPRVVEDIFASVAAAPEEVEFTIRASYLEIYMERIRDLLDPERDNLRIREDRTKGIFVQGQKEVYVGSVEDVFEVLHIGQHNRAIASTGMNAQSSRSHSVFLLAIASRNTRDMSTRAGKLYLVDLAGSEKVGKTGAEGTTLNEAKMINKSLSALGNVIKALTSGKAGKDQYVPYRDSKLTRLLQESLGGNARTTLIINCSPSSYNEEETLSTLRFGNRAKTIINRATANVERSAAELKALLAKAEAEIARLKGIIRVLREGGDVPPDEDGAAAAGHGGSGVDLDEVQKRLDAARQAAAADSAASSLKMLELSERLEAVQKQLEAVQDERTALLDAQDGLRADLQQRVVELEKTARELDAARADAQRLLTQSVDAQTQLSEAQLSLRSAQSRSDELAFQVDMLTKDLAAARRELADLHAAKQQMDFDQSMRAMFPFDPSHSAPSASASAAATTTTTTGGGGGDAEWGTEEEGLRSDLQKGLERFQELGRDLFGSSEAPDAQKVVGAIEEIRALSQRLSVSPVMGGPGKFVLANSQRKAAEQDKDKDKDEDEDKDKSGAESEAQIRAEYEARVKALEERNAELEARSRAFEKRATGVEQLAAEMERYKADTERKLAKLAAYRDGLLQDLESRCLRVIELQTQVEDLHSAYSAAHRAKESSAERTLKKQCLGQQREIQKLSRRVDDLEGEARRTASNADVLRQRLASREEYERELENQVRGLQMSLRDAVIKGQQAEAAALAQTRPAGIAYGAHSLLTTGQLQGDRAARGLVATGRITKVLRGGGGAGSALGGGLIRRASPPPNDDDDDDDDDDDVDEDDIDDDDDDVEEGKEEGKEHVDSQK